MDDAWNEIYVKYGSRRMHRQIGWESQKEKKAQNRTRRIWKINNEMDLRETGWDDMKWIHLA
jgi:hypothetical protein